MRLNFALPLLAALLAAAPAHADPRVQQYEFDTARVYPVIGHRAIQTMIEFAEDEHIENIAVGDASAWQVTPNKRANAIFVKPLFVRSTTNMTVVTDRHRYLFELVNGTAQARRVYLIRFNYPEDLLAAALAEKNALAAMNAPEVTGIEAAAPPPPPPPVLNRAWKYSGDRSLTPASIYDDGKSTFIAWSQSHELPGIFMQGLDGMEGAVNFTVQGDYLVIDGVASRYILRKGRARAYLTNLAPRAAVPVAAIAPPAAAPTMSEEVNP